MPLRGRLAWMTGFACFLAALAAAATEPVLTVAIAGHTTTYTRSALLAHPLLATITVPNDPSYRTTMTYQAVPVSVLLGGIAPDASLRFTASDGFVAMLQASLLFDSGDTHPRAYLAIEPADAPWPPLKGGEPATAGPFYVVWQRPQLGMIVPEEWPYRVVKIEETGPLAQRFPAIVPPPGLAAGASVKRGFALAMKNCLVCHTINLGGDATVGPDLNVPFNPTEYLRADALRRLIRDPQSLHRWPNAKMPGFEVSVLSDRDLNDVLAYLRYMASRKVPVPPPKQQP
jgi:mono/diheme cytochrome c family protein